MSYHEERLQEIADAIREVKGTTEKIPATNFASEIVGLSVVKPSGIKTITENGDYDVTNYAWASVNVQSEESKFAELVDGSITTIEETDLKDVVTIRDGAFKGLTSITSVAIPSNVTTIGASAFSGCSGITTLTLAEGVTTIGASAFSGISASEINIPSTLTSVGENAFANNTVLSEITIPDTLTSLPAGLFSGCANLINVTMEATTPPSVTDTTFPSSASIYVKYGAYDDYVAQWSAYASQIVRLPAIPSTITITVNNYLGEMVSGASVTIEGNGQTYTGTTDSVGVFMQGDLQPATYTISIADLDGFKTPESQEVVVLEDTQNSVTFTYLEKPAISETFGENDWITISNISNEIASNNMTAEQVETTYGWKLGDVKSETLSTGEVIELQIIDFNHDDKSDGSGKAGITLQTKNCLATLFPMNSTANANGGWQNCTMRTTTLPTIQATLSQELQSVIKSVTKYSASGPGFSAVATTDTLFLLSLIEASNKVGDTEGEGVKYAYRNLYRYQDTDGDGSSETLCWWWTRSTYKNSYRNYRALKGGNDADRYSYAANEPYGVSFAFCV